MSLYYDHAGIQIYHGDCLEVMPTLEADSIDAVVCDPPYGLSFMGKKWDYEVPSVAIWRHVLRVLKPGGHILAFGGTRTYHRMVVNIEDGGFEIRDQLQWLYGQGFPKSLDISKAIDKAAGVEREIVGKRKAKGGENINILSRPEGDDKKDAKGAGAYGTGARQVDIDIPVSIPTTDEAKQWEGWGTALKPSNEPICLARKPLSESNIVANVLKHGTGAMNIDAGRIDNSDADLKDIQNCKTKQSGDTVTLNIEGHSQTKYNEKGRWPANVILDEEARAMLDEQSGILTSGEISAHCNNKGGDNIAMSGANYPRTGAAHAFEGSDGGASRFFYCAKASKAERGKGNDHPTVKPLSLISYLCRLITPPHGVILDPFMGSGTTLCAAKELFCKAIGIEIEEKYCEIAAKRLSQEVLDL